MPVSWLLSLPVITPPGVIQAGSVYAPDSTVDVGVPYYHDQADFLTVAGQVLPDWYLSPLEMNGQGYELLQAYAKMFEQVSLAIGTFQVLATLSYSSGGSYTYASIQFYRPSLFSGSFTIKAGTTVATSKTNRQYQTTADISVGVDDWFVSALVRSVGQDSDYAVKGPLVLQDGTVLPGEIDTIISPNTVPPFAEPALAVRQVADAYGGTAPVLDQIGDDRGIERNANESDATYKQRARALADTITPAAIQRHLDKIFYPLGLHYDFIETWESRYQACWNAPDGVPTHLVFGSLVSLAYNDPRTDRFIPRWMGERDHRSAVVVVVPTFPAIADRGMAYNDPATGPTPTRAVSAWNSPIYDGPSLSGAYNGADEAGDASRSQFLSSTYNLLESIKGGGVNVSFIPQEATEVLPGAPYP